MTAGGRADRDHHEGRKVQHPPGRSAPSMNSEQVMRGASTNPLFCSTSGRELGR